MKRTKLNKIKRKPLFIKVLVCAGYNTSYCEIAQRLDDIQSTKGISLLMHDGIEGVEDWAINNDIKDSPPDKQPDLILMFPGGKHKYNDCQVVHIRKGSTECIASVIE